MTTTLRVGDAVAFRTTNCTNFGRVTDLRYECDGDGGPPVKRVRVRYRRRDGGFSTVSPALDRVLGEGRLVPLAGDAPVTFNCEIRNLLVGDEVMVDSRWWRVLSVAPPRRGNLNWSVAFDKTSLVMKCGGDRTATARWHPGRESGGVAA